MDDGDRARIREEQELFIRLKEIRRRIQHPRSDNTCIDCGEIIPLARRKAMPGCMRCFDCQTEFEAGV